MRKMTLAVVVLVLAASLASFAAEPAALSCASSGQALALVGTAAPAVPLFGPQDAPWLQTPLLAASTAALTPPKRPALCSLSCTPCQPGGGCCLVCGTCALNPIRCN
jgi:hypothetical protein